jgi:hypothetical protein
VFWWPIVIHFVGARSTSTLTVKEPGEGISLYCAKQSDLWPTKHISHQCNSHNLDFDIKECFAGFIQPIALRLLRPVACIETETDTMAEAQVMPRGQGEQREGGGGVSHRNALHQEARS